MCFQLVYRARDACGRALSAVKQASQAKLAIVASACIVLLAITQDNLQERLKRDVTALAGPEMAGRGNGQEGLNKAINYVINKYRMLGIEPEIQRFPYRLANSENEEPNGYFTNIVATINGRDPELSSQHIVVGAHLDHLGTRPNPWGDSPTIYYGADDNASGTAAVMELARYYHTNTPARTLLFIHFTGEEWGLHGSKYWVSHPTVDLNSVRFMANLDMIGRLNPNNMTLALTAMGMGPDALRKVKAMAPKGVRVEIDRGTSVFASGSDHAPFAANNIPTCFFFTGIHPDYHRPTDTVDKINWNGLATITQYAQRLITEYATAKDVPEFQPRANLGITPEPGKTVRVWSVSEGGSAEAACLKQGDVLTYINNQAVGSPEDLDRVLDLFSRGDSVKLKWKRGKSSMESKVVLQ